MQYARSKVDFVIGEKMYMIPSDMNLRIGRIKNYNNKILESKSYFKLGINKKINFDEEKGKPDVKPEGEGIVKTKPNVKQKKEPDIKSNKEHKPNIELKHDVKMIRTKPDTNKITYEEEKVALILELQLSLQYGGCSNDLSSPCLCHEICVYQNTNTCYESPQILRQPTNHFLSSIQDL